MNTSKYLTIISIILNLFLAACLFFKSALNQVFVEWWQKKCKRREDFVRQLIELRKNLLVLQRLALVHLIDLAVLKSTTDSSSTELNELKRSRRDIGKKCGEAFTYVQNNEVHYPKEIRELFKQFRYEFSQSTAEILKGGTSKERLFEIYNDMERRVNLLIEKVEGYLI